ncbi:MAG: SRPBCC family protein, partial [Gemmatimonadaceae bacterium]|nr:SRPBCC family protein [Gemmatimonadaceae bacterium]
MTYFSTTIEIQAPPERVWAVMRDVERWPEWSPTMMSVRLLDTGPLRVGSRAHMRQPKLRPGVWEVTELTEGRNFTWVLRSPGLRVAGGHEIEPTPEGSRVVLSLRFSGLLGPLLARLYRALNERYLCRIHISDPTSRSY